MSLLLLVAIASSGAATFYFIYVGYQPLRDWLTGSTLVDTRRYQTWLDELFINWPPQKVSRAALAARMSIIGVGFVTVVLSGSAVFAAAAAFATYWVPLVLYRTKKEKRLQRFEEQLPDAINAMVSSVRAGNALSFAIEDVASKFSGEPIGQEFGLIAREHSSGGLSIEDALARARDRIRLESFTMISSAAIINASQGGDLLHILERMADATRSLSRLQKKIVTETSEIRAQEKVILLMTPVFGVLVCFFDPSIFDILAHTTAGNILLVVVAGLQLFCVAWIRSIVRTAI